jgi:molybdopterin converting factor small subunit
MKILIPTLLRDYTGGAREVACAGATLAEILADLEQQFPGIRFRMVDEQEHIRRHMRVFAGGRQIRELAAPLAGVEEVVIVQALSGG